MKTTLPQLLLSTPPIGPRARRCAKKNMASGKPNSLADLAQLVEKVAAGLHQAGLQRHEHMVVIGAHRPRLYATMLAAQSLVRFRRRVRGCRGRRMHLPANNAEALLPGGRPGAGGASRSSCQQCPQIARIIHDDRLACATTTRKACDAGRC